MKKGFGNTTAGLFSSYKYMESPYDNQRDLDKREKMNHKAKISTPFCGSSNPQATFTADYQAYHLEGEHYQQPRVDETSYRSKTQNKWTYNNPNKKSFYGTFTQFPNYIE